MYKTKEKIEEENMQFILGLKELEVSEGCYSYKDCSEKVFNLIHQIRQDDLKEVKKIIKEKGLHLGYGNDILEKLDNLNR